MRPSDPSALILLAAWSSCGAQQCGPTEETGGELEPFACTLGIVAGDGTFAPLLAGDGVELQLGFQGLLFVELWVSTPDEVPSPLTAAVQIAPSELSPAGASELEVELVPVGGELRSEPIQVFFEPGQLSALTDRPAEAAVRLTGPERTCVASVGVTLVDDDPCIHTGDEPICPGDTGWEG